MEILSVSKGLDLVQPFQHRRGILRPEDNHPRLVKGNLVDDSAVGVLPPAPALAQPRHEPIGIKRRNVRLAAGGKDDRRHVVNG